MTKTIMELQSVVPLPLQIDSSNAEVIETATRIYNGKPIINSVNGKKKVWKKFSLSSKVWLFSHRPNLR